MTRQPPAFLKALGKKQLPPSIELSGKTYALRRVFKNDFFAVTAMYEAKGEKVLVKIGRTANVALFPMAWVGRVLAARETAALHALQDLDGIPRFIGRIGETGIVREFIEGQALAKGQRVDDEFHPRLQTLITRIHERSMAYVDLEKCENVLVGEDGRPYLFDFQICWYCPKKYGGQLWPARILRSWFQSGDRYHLVKLQRRTRPDQLTPEALAASYKKPLLLRLYRIITRPFTTVRRAVLNRIDPRRNGAERGRITT